MSHLLPARWLAALPAAVVLSAVAQTPPAPPGAPALPYRSAFENYQRFQDDKPVAWKEANDTVRERGGWRAYAREGAEAAKPPGQAPAAPGEASRTHDAHDAHGAHDAHDPHANHGSHTPPPAPAGGAKEQP